MVRRLGPWALSGALHVGLAAIAYVAVAGIVQPQPVKEQDATYTVAIRPGGGPTIGDARPADASKFGAPSNVVVMEDVPLTGVPDLELKPSSVQLPPSTQTGTGTPGRVYQHGAVAKFPANGNGGGSATGGGPGTGAGAGTGTGVGMGEGTDPGVEAIPLETPAPVYPEAARRSEAQGTVVAEIRIDRGGNVESARVSSGSGHTLLDDAALAAVKAWKYRPATLAGEPRASVRRVRFVFRLE